MYEIVFSGHQGVTWASGATDSMRRYVVNAKVRRYENLTKTMNIPNNRKSFSQPNVLWFLRAGAMQNRNHKNVRAAYALARELA